MSDEHFGGRLKELREQAGLTQPDLANRAGLSKDGVAHLEQGRRKPSWETVLALAKALGVRCGAFEQPPTATPEPRRGRPKKAAEKPAPKQQRR